MNSIAARSPRQRNRSNIGQLPRSRLPGHRREARKPPMQKVFEVKLGSGSRTVIMGKNNGFGMVAVPKKKLAPSPPGRRALRKAAIREQQARFAAKVEKSSKRKQADTTLKWDKQQRKKQKTYDNYY